MKEIFFILVLAVLILVQSCTTNESNESLPLNEIKGTYEPQLNYLNEALEDDPDDDELLYKRAQVYENMYRNADALADINKAIKLNGEKSSYYFLLARIHYGFENYYEAIKAGEQAERLGAAESNLFILQAKIFWAIDDTSRSNYYVNKALSTIPFHSDIQLLRAKKSALKGDTLQAITYLLSSVRADKKNMEAYKDLIQIYLNKSKDDSALYYTIQAKEIDPANPNFYYSEARIYQKRDLKQSAVISYLLCIKRDTTYYKALLPLAHLYDQMGNPMEALRYYNRYLGFDNSRKEVYKSVIAIMTDMRREKETIPYYERLTQLDSTNIGLKYHLQKLYKLYAVETPQTPLSAQPPVNPIVASRDTTRRVVTPAPATVDTSVATPVQMPDSIR